MLDAITDFWKPIKKTQSQERLETQQLHVGSSVGFGFVPQGNLSGRRLEITAINTYQFGEEALTSFVLTQTDGPGVSMIVAESDGEQYLAISRRIAPADRTRLLNASDLDAMISKKELSQVACKTDVAEFKGWTVASYKREIQGMKGRIFSGDYRKAPLPSDAQAQEFEYTLLVSESNEHALEVEKYADGHLEVYATVYRRINDIGELSLPEAPQPVTVSPMISAAPALPAKPMAAPVTAAPVVKNGASLPPLPKTVPFMSSDVKASAPAVSVAPAINMAAQPKIEAAKPESVKVEAVREPVLKAGEAKAEPIHYPEFSKADVASKQVSAPIAEKAPEKPKTIPETNLNGTRNTMNAMTADNDSKPRLAANFGVAIDSKKTTSGIENESIECELRVANRIIDEAIRSEMRLSDVVRRVIELPVANQEAVQIPVTLSDEDYSLLAIRYGIPSSDRAAIKRRIIEDLNDFSGAKKNA